MAAAIFLSRRLQRAMLALMCLSAAQLVIALASGEAKCPTATAQTTATAR